ncbi:antitoxin Xre/MbcA/ParS toxin-binding domain-containing protein [Trinickia acidisoli]|uniref:antitoxin Xre/MbcA/ParS toxin-binding domain-containing protein n=1 Tax=Trinickia acidisoli TaxID=2767482 RepID=UPI001A8DC792|nr:antitoxin Xre/MbcA/ParS toxin-binding domain-containing protein [Trinickia acidisoli]
MPSIDHVGTHGLGAQEYDVELFDMLDPSEQRRLIKEGMAPEILERLARDVLCMSVLGLVKSLDLAPSTLQRRIKADKHDPNRRLSPAESDRVARVLIILKSAREFFGNRELAVEWMKRPLVQLNLDRPLDVLDTQPGYDRVKDILLRASEGVSA